MSQERNPSPASDSSVSARPVSPSIYKKLNRSARLRQKYSSQFSLSPTFIVKGHNGTKLVENALLKMKWCPYNMDSHFNASRLMWTDTKSQVHFSSLKNGLTAVNHIPNLSELLCNKMALLKALSEYERVFLAVKRRLPDLPISEFLPESYCISSQKQILTFKDKYQEGDVWICKPAAMNQGNGIKLIRKYKELTVELDDRLVQYSAYPRCGLSSFNKYTDKVIQRYISNPLLLEGRKFDIRSYLLMASTAPFLVLCRSGYARVSLYPYTFDSDILATHLTNQCIQRHEACYEENKDETVWSMDRLSSYVDENCQHCSTWQPNWIQTSFEEQCERIMRHTIKSVLHKLPKEKGFFELLGFDFLIDENLKIWLLEVNSNPALSTNCKHLQELLPVVVEDTVKIATECHKKSRKGHLLLPLECETGFKILYSEETFYNRLSSDQLNQNTSKMTSESTARRNASYEKKKIVRFSFNKTDNKVVVEAQQTTGPKENSIVN